MYLLGMHTFLIETDHKPLVPLLSIKGGKRLHELPARVLHFRLCLARYSYTIIHVPGSHLTSDDAFSRAPTDSAASCDDLSLEADCSLFAAFAVSSVSVVTSPTRAVLRAQKAYTTCQDITRLIRDGWPSSIQNLPAPLRSHWPVRADLVINDKLIMMQSRVLIPSYLEQDTLDNLHTGHPGVSRTTKLSQTTVWLPGISNRIKALIEACPTCREFRRPHIEPLISSTTPPRPWHTVGIDLFQYDTHQFIVVVNYYSRYPEVLRLTSMTSARVIEHLNSVFARHGVPAIIRSDNGPQFSSAEFHSFS